MNWKLIFSFALTIIIPILYLINIFLAYFLRNTYQGPIFLIILGILFAFLGLIFWAASFIHLGKAFGVLPKEQKRIKKGLYKYFNHPMYIGIWFTFLGLSLANQSIPALLFLFIILTPILIIRANLEEKKLVD
jgi:protein-S-isoprenylcysteine O-methyltransferase Ste14